MYSQQLPGGGGFPAEPARLCGLFFLFERERGGFGPTQMHYCCCCCCALLARCVRMDKSCFEGSFSFSWCFLPETHHRWTNYRAFSSPEYLNITTQSIGIYRFVPFVHAPPKQTHENMSTSQQQNKEAPFMLCCFQRFLHLPILSLRRIRNKSTQRDPVIFIRIFSPPQIGT